MRWPIRASNSSKVSGRLSSALGRRKPKSTRVCLRERSPWIHAAHLRDRLVAFVDHQQEVVGEIFEQGRRRVAGGAAGEMTGIVLDAVAVADLAQHLEVEAGALLEALRLQELALVGQLGQPLGQLQLDPLDRPLEALAGGDVVGLGEEADPVHLLQHLAAQRVEAADALDLVAEVLDTDAHVLGSGQDLKDVATHPEGAVEEVELGALILHVDQPGERLLHAGAVAPVEELEHAEEGLGRSQPVDAGDRGDDEHVAAVEQRLGGPQAQAVDLLVDGGLFLDVGVGRGDVGLGLVVVVVGDEVLDGVVREEAPKLLEELGGQGLVVGEDEGRAVDRLDHLGDGEGLARAGDAEQHLLAVAALDAADELADGGGLVALGGEARNELEAVHAGGSTPGGGDCSRWRPPRFCHLRAATGPYNAVMEYDPLPPTAPGRRAGVRGAAAAVGDWPWRRILKWGWPVAAAVAVGAVGGMGFAAAIHVPRVESVVDFTPSLITQLHAADGTVFATFARERRVMLQEGEIPPLLANAVIAVEDSHFRQHGGVDALAILRAQAANLRAGHIEEGASTLTMQLARKLFLSPERRWRRKIEEAFLAVELEKRFTKQQILTLYLNLVNLGHGNYGVEAAARYYFNKSVGELTLPEAATLAGIIQRPTSYSPYRNPALVEERRDKVLRRMLEEGYIDPKEHKQAVATPLLVVTHTPQDRLGPYFAEEVRKHLDATYGTDQVVEGGLQVETTLDPRIQHAAEEALRAGLVSLDHRKGWRGPLAALKEDDLAAHVLPSWTGTAPEPGRWVQGIVLSSNRHDAAVKIEDRTYSLTAEGIAWTHRDRPSDLLKAGDVAWFQLAAPKKEGGEPRLMLEQEPQLEGAVVVLESATGAIRAMVGGWDFVRNKFNRVTQAHRQVGSAFKPFVYGAALETGLHPRRHAVRRPHRLPRRRRPAQLRAAELLPEVLRDPHPAPRPRAVDQRRLGQAAGHDRRRAGDRLRPPLRHRV